ncbi:hypothetical protein BHU72_11165 [Desulfuribacillus stibiiarsenatis]|uniref:Threonine/Serine exporter ThrE domain-containing protein n=1 Tax=Desulfuribacillus stibiiarsenatis TaxID=1390249 RepID=A0A1E5L2P2_9FIRM|nr:threonine/serine exporter family protein [Desulfuribacillus stibiiarsenatis]OEH84388.1 hypothetical protein BHU72_11165 [Desulfuribacillus stibiiarsenatis]
MLLEVFFAFLASAGFAILFQAPKSCLFAGGMIGTGGWISYRLLALVGVPNILTLFFAAIVVAALSEWMARVFKVPVTVFAVSGIIPLVPGSIAYSTMYNFARGNYIEGLALGAKTFLTAGAIAAGLVFVGALARIVKYQGDQKHGESIADNNTK